MAVLKKPVPAVVSKPVAKPVAKPTTKPVAKPSGFEVVDMANIQLVPKASGGGGKSLSPFATKAFSLAHGTGFKITEEQYGENGKKLASTYAGAARRGIKLRVRRDVNGALWLFRVSEEDETAANEAKEQRKAEREAQLEGVEE
jgi:hypothetical protein